MELTKKALEAITKEPSKHSRIMNLIAAEMRCSESSVRRWINNNTKQITMAAAVKIIKQETGLADKDILTDSKKIS